MNLIHKLKLFERQILYVRWAGDEGYGRLTYVGSDFIEFETLDVDTMEFTEKILINAQLVLEVVVQSSDISRVIAEYSSNLPSATLDIN